MTPEQQIEQVRGELALMWSSRPMEDSQAHLRRLEEIVNGPDWREKFLKDAAAA